MDAIIASCKSADISIATWNAAMLMSADLQEAMMASMQKASPRFRD